MWHQFIKRKNPEENEFMNLNPRIHVDTPMATAVFQANLDFFLTKLYDPTSQLIILCIGTDRSTGDSLGPLTGSKLSKAGLGQIQIYGTLDEPVHAVNLAETITLINAKYRHPFIIAIDACLGRTESVGYISIKEGSLQPGTGVNKDLPAVGDLHIIGVVNVGGFMEYMVLQNTRLNLVMKMADLISAGIIHTIRKTATVAASHSSVDASFLEPAFPFSEI